MTMTFNRELTIAQVVKDAPVVMGIDPIDAKRNAEAAASREPMISAALPRNRANPHGGFGPLKVGDKLIVTNPVRYNAEVIAVSASGREVVVTCRARANRPEYLPPDQAGRRAMKDNWVTVEWHQTWALAETIVADPQEPRNQWRETHCIVVEDDRPLNECQTADQVMRRADGEEGSPPPVLVVRDTGEAEPAPVEEPLSAVQIIRETKGLPKLHAAVALAEKRGVKIDDIEGEGRADRILDRLEQAKG